MSIEINWETLTSGPDGDALAERIRDFIHGKFQTVQLPRFIKSVTVHGFDFGTIPPQLELKGITDPLPDFYEAEIEGDSDSDDNEDEGEDDSNDDVARLQQRGHQREGTRGPATLPRHGPREDSGRQRPGHLREIETLRREMMGYDLGSPFMRSSTPGLLGGAGLSYFQGHHLGTGAHTPLAAVAGAQLGSSWLGVGGGGGGSFTPYVTESVTSSPRHSRHPSQSSMTTAPTLREKSSVSTLAPTSAGTSRPPTRDPGFAESAIAEDDDEDGEDARRHGTEEEGSGGGRRREPRVEDVQAVFRIQYRGDIRLQLTAEILLDYPMPSFVGIPLKLNITGLSFDGVGVLAHIRKRVHFCFLSPEDAMTAIGPDDGDEDEGEQRQEQGPAAATQAKQQQQQQQHKGRMGGLLQEIKVESEIGEREGGKQSLKNVGKVERFVLEQVRRIFEEEFVYPSFWTFLV